MRSSSLTIGLTGSTGFVGGAIARLADASGHRVRPIPAPRLALHEGADIVAYLTDQSATQAFDAISAGVAGCDVVVHAAGLARPESSPDAQLIGANAALPTLVAHAARSAGVSRFVHVSSAAVQGSIDPLDETMRHAPLSPYARSKALGEVCLRSTLPVPPETVVFRPTSVQGHGRGITASLCRMLSRRWMPVFGDGHSPLPVALVDNVAAAVLVLAQSPKVPAVALYPWEGLTLRHLIEIIGRAQAVFVPSVLGRAAVAGVLTAGRASAACAAVGRRLELLVRGQGQEAPSLPALGFVPPVGHEGYRDICRPCSGD